MTKASRRWTRIGDDKVQLGRKPILGPGVHQQGGWDGTVILGSINIGKKPGSPWPSDAKPQ